MLIELLQHKINPRHEKMEISFYINQFHLWNNSMFLETICLFFLFCTGFFICIFIFFYLYIFILEMLGKLLWNSHRVVNIAWHAAPLTTWRTKRSKVWIFLFILFPIYLCPTSSLIKKKRTGVKTEQLKILTWPHKNKGNKNLADFLNAPFSS